MNTDALKQYLDKPDVGLFLLRVIVGAMIIAHGVGKFMSGNFEGIGEHMALFGIDFGFVFWGFMAALAQTVGGFFVVIGFVFRLSCFMVLFTMIVAVTYHISAGDGIMGAGSAITTGSVFLALMFTGSGRFAIRQG